MPSTDSTMLLSTEISGGLVPDPMFCIFVFGEETLSLTVLDVKQIH